MASYGNVYTWGDLTSGEISEVESVRGKTVASMAAYGASAVVLDSHHGVHWLSERPVGGDAVQDACKEMEFDTLALGDNHVIAVDAHGMAYCWGSQSHGQAGTGLPQDCPDPELLTRLGDANIAQVAAGESHSAALTDVGTLYMWGRNLEGQCGQGYASAKARAKAGFVGQLMAPRFVHALTNTPVARVACGGRFTLAVSTAGALWAWGEGTCGQLGIGRVTKRDRPVLVAETAEDGSRYAWGFNAMGQLGLGDVKSRHFPTRVRRQLPEGKASEQAEESKALSRTNSVISQSAFHPGDDDEADGLSPAGFLEHTVQHRLTIPEKASMPNAVTHSLERVLPPAPWEFPEDTMRAVKVSAGDNHSAAITEQGHLYTWGCARDGRLGLHDVTQEVTNGDVVLTVAVPIRYPRMVSQLRERIITDVACNKSTTTVVAGCALESIQPVNGPLTGGAVVTLLGGGLGALAARNTAKDMELTAGSEIPGVTVRFTRAAAEVGPDDEDDEEEGGLGNGGGYDSEGEVDSEAVELVLEVPALVSRDDSNDGIQCLTPMFHHPCEVTVEVVVDGVDLVPGSRSFRFYAPPSSISVECDAVPLMMPQDLHLSGSGLFGAMLSHPSTHDAAQALIDDVERKWNEQEELQREKEEAEEAAALGLTVPKPPPATDGQVRMIVLEEGGAVGVAEAKNGDERPDGKTAEDATAPLVCPSIGLQSAIALRAKRWPGPLGLSVRFTLLCNGEETDACVIVPAEYSAVYADLDEEAKARQEQERADAIAANPLDIPDDESVDGPPGEFKASLQCTFPSMEPSADIEAKRDAGDCTLTLVVSVAPNGVDFVGACKIPAFSPTFDGVEPAAGCLTDSRTYALRGKGFEKMAGTKAKFSAGGKTWTSNVKFVDSTTMTFSLPKNMKLPPVEEPVEGSEDEETKLRYPSFGVGIFEVELQLGKDMTSGKPAEFTGYIGDFASVFPPCGPICGGTTIQVQLTHPEEPFLFDLDGLAHVKLTGPDFETIVPLIQGLDKEAGDYGTAKFVLPPRLEWPPTPASDTEGVDGGEGEEEKGGEAGADDGAAEEKTEGKAEDSGSAAGEGEEGEEVTEAAPPRPKLKNKNVSVEITLNGTHYHKKMQFSFFDETELQLESVEPAKTKAGTTITVAGAGWSSKLLRHMIVELKIDEDVWQVKDATIGEEGGLEVVLPEDLPLGTCFLRASLDAGQTWTSEDTSPSFTVSKK